MLNKANQKSNLKENIYQKDLVKILKAKRLEQGKSLEEVSNGICSASYLSRIENNHVRLQEPYMKLLFEKLSIDYNELKTTRNVNYCTDFLKKKLLNLDETYYEMLNKMLNSKNYLDIEQQLILLYDDILNKKFNESEILMEKIDRYQMQLSYLEQQFYQYLISFYYYSIGQTVMAFRQLKNIVEETIFDEILYFVVYDLYLMILFELGKYNTYANKVNVLYDRAPDNYFLEHKIKHHFLTFSLLSKEEYTKAIKEINDYYESKKMLNQNIVIYYNYAQILANMFNHEYYKAFKILQSIEKNSKNIVLLLICLINIKYEDLDSETLNLINKYYPNEYEDIIKYLKEYLILKNTGSFNILRMQTLLKNRIFNLLKTSYSEILYQEIAKEILNLSIRCSKYKEGCNFLINQYYDKSKNNIY